MFGGIFIGKSIGGLVVNYNICLLIANIFLLFSFTVLLNIKVNNSTNNKHEDISLKNIFKDKILNLFSLYVLIGTIAFISNNIVISLIAITWSIFISTSYENICDAVYINRLENKYQLSFSNICHIIRFLGEAIGVYLCGLMYEIGLRYMLGLSALLMIFQISLAYYLIYLRKREKINIEVNKNEKIRN